MKHVEAVKGKWRGVGESLSKGAVAHACIFIICFGVAASKKLEEGTLPQRDPKQAKTAGKFKGFFASTAARCEAGSAWSQQSCSKWCDKHALSPLTACAAAAMLTAVLARADSSTLASAGHTLELSDGCSWSTPRRASAGPARPWTLASCGRRLRRQLPPAGRARFAQRPPSSALVLAVSPHLRSTAALTAATSASGRTPSSESRMTAAGRSPGSAAPSAAARGTWSCRCSVVRRSGWRTWASRRRALMPRIFIRRRLVVK